MGQINKGKIASLDGNMARVVPSDAGAKPTAKITIPWHLRGETGNLKKGTDVVYVEFDDATGLLLGRADGEWGAYLPSLVIGSPSTSDNSAKLGTAILGTMVLGSSSTSDNNAKLGTSELGAIKLG